MNMCVARLLTHRINCFHDKEISVEYETYCDDNVIVLYATPIKLTLCLCSIRLGVIVLKTMF